MRLCYVDGPWAYFTDQPVTGVGCQWGDDWDDAPYEHNAEPPYNNGGEKIVKVAWEGPFDAPCEFHSNSPYSVEMINAGAIPWLSRSKWSGNPQIYIPAGVTLTMFVTLIEAGGGQVYTRYDTKMPEWKQKACEQILNQRPTDYSYLDSPG